MKVYPCLKRAFQSLGDPIERRGVTCVFLRTDEELLLAGNYYFIMSLSEKKA